MGKTDTGPSEDLSSNSLPPLIPALEPEVQEEDVPSSPTILTPPETDDEATGNPTDAAIELHVSLPASQELSEGNHNQEQEVAVAVEDASTEAPANVDVSAKSAGGDADEPESCPDADQAEPSSPIDAGLEASAQEQSEPSDAVLLCSLDENDENEDDDENDNDGENDDENENENGEWW
jgi:hypothetical protein